MLLSPWLIEVPMNWLERVNQTEDEQELESLRPRVQRGRPFGQPEWQKKIAKRLGLESAYRPTGRPRKANWGGRRTVQLTSLRMEHNPD